MALTRIKTWIIGEVLQAGDLNSEIDNIINSSLSLISPLTGNLDFNGLSALNFGLSVGGFRVALTHEATANRTITFPDGTLTLSSVTGTETLTNKTINLSNNTFIATSAQLAAALTDETGSGLAVFGTSPTLVTPIISATGWANANHAHTGSTTGGLVSVTPTTATADVTTSETTTSTSYTNLATSGPAITLTPGSTLSHIIWLKAELGNNTSGEEARMSVAIGGATAVDADAAEGAADSINNVVRGAASLTLATSQTSGATHTCKYKVSAGTGTFRQRRIVGMVLGG